MFNDLSNDMQGIQSKNGLIYFILIAQSFLPMQNMLLISNLYLVPLEKNVLFKENSENMYRMSSYFISKTISELPLQILLGLLFTLGLYWAVDLNPQFDKFAIFSISYAALILCLIMDIGVSIGIIGGCIFQGVKEALLIGQYLIIPFMLFGGMFVNINSFPRAFVWYAYISV
jgi:ABC-type multidrug transport system permease subunit